MSSYIAAGNQINYVLPFQRDQVPSSFKSNLAPRPVNCTMSTVAVPSTSGNANFAGTTTINVPLGQAAYMCNPYLRFKVAFATGGDTANARFKGSSQSAMSLISSYQTSINSTLIDNINNFSQVADCLLTHSCSKEWLNADGAVLMATASTESQATTNLVANLGLAKDGVITNAYEETFCIPLLGLLSGGGQSFPLWSIAGTLAIQIQWQNAANNAFYGGSAGDITGVTISNVNLVYDRVAVEADFIAKMKQDMASTGAKFAYSFTNYQSVTQPSQAGTVTNNTAINVSSLRGVVILPILTAVGKTSTQWPQPAGTNTFQFTLDGRLINNNNLDAVAAPAVCFAELSKVFSRAYDASVTDNTSRLQYRGPNQNGVDGAKSFALGVSTTRVSEGLQFSGSPASVAGVLLTQNSGDYTNYIVYISDYCILVDGMGQVDIVR